MSYSHNYGSFDYKVINPVIKEVLNTRTVLDNTVQLAMPFVKATTTLQLPSMLGTGNIGFTLGIHGIDENVYWEDMYSELDSDMPLIGYTYTVDGTPRKIYAKDFSNDIFVNNLKLYSSTTKLNRLPPPGITQVTVGRNKNGLLASGQLNIVVPSLLQLESLQKTFLIPGIGMILEWGQQFAISTEPVNTQYGELGLNETTLLKSVFPWHDRNKLEPLLKRLAYNQIGLPEILLNYVYPTQGQYMWMFGRIGNFTISGNSDGSFECVVKIVGPSEDAWAYSTKNTVVPPKDASTKYFCSTKTNSIYTYFTETVSGPNFKTKLDYTRNEANNSPWKNHVIKFTQGNKKDGKEEGEKTSPVTSQKSFGDLEDAYFITWKFFVNEVLNGVENSVKSSVFGTALVNDELRKVGMLLPFADGETRNNTDVANIQYINDPFESFVGLNQHLRSVDPSTMIIVNETAVGLASGSNQYQRINDKNDIFQPTDDSKKFVKEGLGTFDQSVVKFYPNKPDAGFLSTGVWLNHKAIVECMLGADTLMRGIVNLLDRMNAATLNYWQLTLDTIEPLPNIDSSYNYIVIDANYRENSSEAVSKFIRDVHTFNKLTRLNESSSALVGSELINSTVDLSLPKLMFSQIATLGLVQPEDLRKLGIDNTQEGSSPKLSSPNDTIRKIFAESITSLETYSDYEQGPDLTIPPKIERKLLIESQKVCGATNTNTTAQTSGDGARADRSDTSTDLTKKSTEDLIKEKEKAIKKLENNLCIECKKCVPSPTPVSPTGVPTTTPTPTPTATSDLPISNKVLSQMTLKEIIAVQKPNGRVLAVGKYQAIPKTLRLWIKNESINLDSIFNETLQEQLGDWLITKKRELVGRFINGDSSISVDDALMQLAFEFASIPVPRTITRPPKTAGENDPGRVVNPGESYYSGTAGNSSQNSVVKYQNALITARNTKSVDSLKQFIAKGEGDYDAINTGTANDTKTRTPKYFSVLNPSVPQDILVAAALPENAPLPVTPTPSISCDETYLKVGRELASNDFRNLDAINPQNLILRGKKFCDECDRAKKVIPQIDSIVSTKQTFENKTREFPGLQKMLRYIEVFPDYMVASIAGTANGIFSNAFGASPGSLSISADMELPGINGIRVGELFWIDRMPSFYKLFGAFQVLSIEDTITTNGWTTKIHSRFNYLGKLWKDAMSRILTGG